MNIFFYTSLFILGTLFGSFASVLVYRLKSGEGGIMTGRSHCPKCNHPLSASELIPLLSWLLQFGKCKNCETKISPIYPALELVTGVLFAAVGYFLIDSTLIFSGDILENGRLLFFLSIIFLTVVYSFYDILFLEIPESILLIANIGALVALVLQSLGIPIFPYMSLGGFDIFTLLVCLGVLGALYYVFLAGLKEIYDCLIVAGVTLVLGAYMYFFDISYHDSALLSGTLAALGIYISFFLQIIVSGGRWMGAGDLRIAILMGLLVGVSFVFPAWMISYFAGSILGVGILIFSKVKKGGMHEIPFGPFLAIGYVSILLFFSFISSFIAVYFRY